MMQDVPPEQLSAWERRLARWLNARRVQYVDVDALGARYWRRAWVLNWGPKRGPRDVITGLFRGPRD